MLVDRPRFDYHMSGLELKTVHSTNDLGVLFDSKLSFSDHCNATANKGFQRANMLLKCFHTRDRVLQMKLFNTFIRPVLEYNSPVWCPHMIKDITVIEKVQKYFTKNLRGCKYLTYKQRLSILKQPSLQSRRIRADLIYLYKILHDFVDAELKGLFVAASNVSTCERNLRGHAYKLFMPKPRTDMLKFSYPCRVVKCWNALPAAVCESKSLSVFKKTGFRVFV